MDRTGTVAPEKKDEKPRRKKKRGPGRPPKGPNEKVRRVVCYLTPWAHATLERRAASIETAAGKPLSLESYAKRALERLAKGILEEEGKTPPV